MIKVAIVEDDARVRASLAEIIDNAPGYRCVCGCATAETAFDKIPAAVPDVVLMDIHLPNVSGIECAIRLKQDLPNAQILMLTVYENSELIFKALQGGASGYLLKRTPPVELLNAIAEVMRGGAPMTSEVARRVVECFRAPCQPSQPGPELSRREHEILDLLVRGYINKEIGEHLSIGVETVRTHLKHVYEKLHVRSRTAAVAKYLGAGEKRLQPGASDPREVSW
jgi:DNA-binding NarL/FixJ family response regulator